MNSASLKRLCRAARAVSPPRPSPSFPERVRQAIRQDTEPDNLLDPLAMLFPRFASLAAVVAVLAVGVEWWSSDGPLADLVAEAALTQPDGWPTSWEP